MDAVADVEHAARRVRGGGVGPPRAGGPRRRRARRRGRRRLRARRGSGNVADMTDARRRAPRDLPRGGAASALDRIVETLLALEAGGDAADAVDSLFRDTHSIKGSAGMVGPRRGARARPRDGGRPRGRATRGELSPELTDPLLRATDALRRAVGGESGDGERGAAGAVGGDRSGAASPRRPRRARWRRPNPGRRQPRPSAARSGCRPRRSTACSTRSARPSCTAGGSSTCWTSDAAAEREDEHLEGELDHGELLLDELQDAVDPACARCRSARSRRRSRAPCATSPPTTASEVELEISGAETQLDRVILDGISETAHAPACATRWRTGSSRPRSASAPGKPRARPHRAARRAARRPRRDRGRRRRPRRGRGAARTRPRRAARSPTCSPQAGFSTAERGHRASPAAASASTRSRRTSSRSAAASRCAASRAGHRR